MAIRKVSIYKDSKKSINKLHIIGLLTIVVIMISIMIHYYHYYSKNDTNHLEKHKESISK